jgi:hypothetical protein
MSGPFHPGEIDVQERAGVRERAARVGRIVATRIDLDAAAFLEAQPFVVIASVDAGGRPWASAMSGRPGVIRVEDDVTVRLSGHVPPSDPLRENLEAPGPLAVLAIDLSTRSRYRVNGVGELVGPETIRVRVREAFGNCRKYIQVRHLEPAAAANAEQLSDGAGLSDGQRRFIEAADTFFIATIAEGGADASHRGGRPGFVRIEEDGTLVVPDYTGNNMFQTLGNIASSPRAGLLFVDFESGRALQLTGRAEIDWDEAHAAAVPGAHRLLRVTPARVIESRGALAVRGTLVEPSPFNP